MTPHVRSGLAAMLGAGILAGLAPAVAAAGPWALAALVLASIIAVACGLSTPDRLGILGIFGRVAGAAAVAGTFGAYLAPAHPTVAAIGLIGVVTGFTAAGLRPSGTFLRVAGTLVLAVLVLFVVVCLAVAPPEPAVPAGDRAGGAAGLPIAALLLFFCFLGFEHASTGRRRAPVLVAIGLTLLVCLAVAGAALRQLGAARLAVSPAPLRDALAAADAAALAPALTAAAGVATLLVLLGIFADLRTGTRSRAVPVAGIGAAAGAALLTVPIAITLAAGLMLGEYLLAGLGRRGQRQKDHAEGEHGGDHQRSDLDVAGEEGGLLAVPPHGPGDGPTDAEQDAEPAEPEITEQYRRSRQQRRHRRHRRNFDI
ncbi:hypothetical protein [Actinophytocola sp.]|uniref:hypothetical protein n=1 Tax=Actinophytocola sp. TaxID=1872138 RepID=UPI002D7E8782|nr:hypothetical protein [Actinophytocola sp.]HET9140057.1 hypothetical protein [Actinophytocola sp.]